MNSGKNTDGMENEEIIRCLKDAFDSMEEKRSDILKRKIRQSIENKLARENPERYGGTAAERLTK